MLYQERIMTNVYYVRPSETDSEDYTTILEE